MKKFKPGDWVSFPAVVGGAMVVCRGDRFEVVDLVGLRMSWDSEEHFLDSQPRAEIMFRKGEWEPKERVNEALP